VVHQNEPKRVVARRSRKRAKRNLAVERQRVDVYPDVIQEPPRVRAQGKVLAGNAHDWRVRARFVVVREV
jgi:hypothetical protein